MNNLIQFYGPALELVTVSAANPCPVTGTVTVIGTITVNQGTSPWIISGLVSAAQSGAWLVGVKGVDGAGITTVANPTPVHDYAPPTTLNNVTIANGTSLSAALAIPAGQVVRSLQMPAAWTAANLTFDVSFDAAITFVSMSDTTGAEYARTVRTSAGGPFPTLVGVTNIKLRSGTSAVPVNQGADRVIVVVLG